jgi:hypothetical protein
MKNWNIEPSLYRGVEGLKHLHQLKRDLDTADSILTNMTRMGQDKTPLFMQWKSTRASRLRRYQQVFRARQEA